MTPGGEVHHRVAAPADRPHHLLDFLGGARSDDRIADIGVDLGQEVAADDHRLGLGMIDVGRDDGAAARDLGAHEFGRHHGGDVGAEALAVGERRAAEIFAHGDVFHLLGDDAGARIFELGDVAAGLRTQRLQPRAVELRHRQQLAGLQTVVLRTAVPALIFLDVAAGENPVAAQRRKALADVDLGRTVRVRTGRVVEADRRLAARQRDFAERNTRAMDRDIDLARPGKRTTGDGVVRRRCVADLLVHDRNLQNFLRGRRRMSYPAVPPSAGMNRIRFEGTRSSTAISALFIQGAPGTKPSLRPATAKSTIKLSVRARLGFGALLLSC